MYASSHLFRRFAILTIAAVYLLIAVGSIVRVTGSGMGCPDWPTCFGRLIPPTSVSQLPEDYKTRFAIQGRQIEEFNVVHTWTEYFNRLLGVLVGLLIFVTCLLSSSFWKQDRRVSVYSVSALLLVMFEGWLGAKVVEHNLRPLTVTLHLILALVIVLALTSAIVRSHKDLWADEVIENSTNLRRWLVFAMGIFIVQIILGTQVRGNVDEVAKAMNFLYRDTWLDSVGTIFYVHRSFSILVLAVQLWMLRVLYLAGGLNAPIITWIVSLVILITLEIISGVVMTYLGIPAFIQPMHLALSALIFGIEYMLFLRVAPHRKAGKGMMERPS